MGNSNTATVLLELYHHVEEERTAWIQNLQNLLPAHRILAFQSSEVPNIRASEVSQVEYAVIWRTPIPLLAEMPKLRAVLLCGAGADHLRPFEPLSPNIPIARLVDREPAQDMAAYALHWILHFHLSCDKYLKDQSKKVWQPAAPFLARRQFCVGVLGFGNFGLAVCRTLRSVGYRVIACGRSSRQVEGIYCHSVDDLDEFFSECNALVNFLPLTVDTENLLDLPRFQKLRSGAIFVCMSRGATFVEQALCEALDSRHLKAAVLDTLREKPFPSSSPLWTHERIIITPHISGRTLARSSVQYVAENISRIERGENPFPVIDRQRQY